MSHLSQIKTRLYKTKIVQKTLTDLGLNYLFKEDKSLDIVVNYTKTNNFELIWNGTEYSLITDLEIWSSCVSINTIMDKITQRYSYNSIIEESVKHGFMHICKESMQDGSIKLVVQRWS